MTLHIYKVGYKTYYNGSKWDEDVKRTAKSIIYLYGRDDENNKVVKAVRNFYPYLYVEINKSLPPSLSKYIIKIDNKVYKSVRGESCKKIFTQNPKNIKFIREELEKFNIKTFEDDILYVLRFLIDNKDYLNKHDIDMTGNFRELALDIETTTEFGFPNVKDSKEKITMISNYDNYTDKYYVFAWHPEIEKWKDKFKDLNKSAMGKDKMCATEVNLYNNEDDMLKAWLEWFEKINPDLLLTWYGEQFDIPYIINRLKNSNLNYHKLAVNNGIDGNNGEVYNWLQDDTWFNPQIEGRVIFDVMKFYKHTIMNEKPSYSLDNVAKSELNEGKLPTLGFMESWLNDFRKYIEYNIKDVELTYRIYKKREILKFVNGLREMSGCNFNDFHYFSRLIDLMVLKFAKKENVVLPSKRRIHGKYVPKDKRKPEYQGAYVFALQGKHKNVCALDIKTLYPLIIKTLNISYETISENNTGEIKIGPHSYKREPGILSRVVDDILKISSKYKKLRNDSTAGTYEYEKYANLYECAKFIVVTLYGVQGMRAFRLFDTRNAESITYVGRKIIKFTKEIIEKEGHKVVLIDTDSCYASLRYSDSTPEECIKEGCRLRDLINKKYNEFAKQFNVSKHYFEIKFETLYEKMVIGSKKKYAGKQIWREGKWEKYLSYKGFEVIRSNTAYLTKMIQKEVFDMVLNKDAPYKEVKNYLFEQALSIYNNAISPTKIGIPSAINQENYKRSLPIDRGRKWSNKNINTNFKVGDKPLMVYANHPDTDVVCFNYDYEFDKIKKLGVKINTERMIERCVFMPLASIFEALGWSLKQLREEWKLKLNNQQVLI